MAQPERAPINGVQPTHSSLYPKFDTVAEAEAFACSRTPVNSPNEMRGLLTVFKNTLLKHLPSKK